MSSKELFTVGLDPNSNPDAVLVNSPLRDYGVRPREDQEVLPPLGIAYILSYLAEKNFNVGHLDAEHFGVPVAGIANEINLLRPRWAGMNVLTPTLEMVKKVAGQLDPDVNLVLGGPHATALSERTIKEIAAIHPNTVLIAGEAEHAMGQLVDGVHIGDIAGACWVENGIVRFSAKEPTILHPDQLPIIHRAFLPNDPSIDSHTGRRESRVMTARNCPFDCTFCAGARSSTNAGTRNRSPHHVNLELKGLIADLGVNGIRFVDDLAISSEKRIRSIFDAYEENGLPVFAWDATGRANILARMNDGAFKYMREKGMDECAIGIEAGSERLRKMINKQVEEHEIFESIRKLVEAGIKVKGYFMIGLRTESKEETMQTINLAKRLVETYKGMFRASMFVFRPYPGTQEWSALLEAGWKEDELLQMDADFGSDHRAKHMVVTQHQFGELEPYALANLVEEFNAWQKNKLDQFRR